MPDESYRRTRPEGDLLAKAHGTEIDWERAAPVLRGAHVGQAPFVYVIGEGDDGHVKIGHAMDPIKRLRQLQTGNPNHLRIERLIYGDRPTELLLQGYFRRHAVAGRRRRHSFSPLSARETEWFIPEARDEIMEAAEAIIDAQLEMMNATENPSVQDALMVVGAVMTGLGYALAKDDEVRLLGRVSGYATGRTRAA